MNNLFFSVVIPLYNKEKSIASTVESVLNQTFQDFEIVVVDDGSTDRSAAVVSSVPDGRIRLIRKENGGVSSARNVGFRNAKYDYVAFLDADDLWEKTYLEEIARLINDFPQCGIYGTGYSYLDNGKYIRAEKTLPDGFRGIIENPWHDHIPHSYCTTTSCCLRKALFDVGGFDESVCYGEDIDVWWRIMLNYPAAYYNKSLAVYRFDFENRLMKKHVDLKKLYICNFEKYTAYRPQNADFSHFIDQECMWWLYQFRLAGTDKSDIERILSMIDLDEYKSSFKFRFKHPKIYKMITSLRKIFR